MPYRSRPFRVFKIDEHALRLLTENVGVRLVRSGDGSVVHVSPLTDGRRFHIALPTQYAQIDIAHDEIEMLPDTRALGEMLLDKLEAARSALQRETIAQIFEASPTMQNVAVKLLQEKHGWRIRADRDLDIAQGNHD